MGGRSRAIIVTSDWPRKKEMENKEKRKEK